MKIQFIDNARKFLRHAWSVRLSLLAAVITFGNAALPTLAQIKPTTTLAALSGIFAVAAVFAQFIPQKKLSGGEDASNQ
jgi:hypothetical protein